MAKLTSGGAYEGKGGHRTVGGRGGKGQGKHGAPAYGDQVASGTMQGLSQTHPLMRPSIDPCAKAVENRKDRRGSGMKMGSV